MMPKCMSHIENWNITMNFCFFFSTTLPQWNALLHRLTPLNILNKGENSTPELFAIYIQNYANQECNLKCILMF